MPYPLTLATMLQRNRLLFGKKEVVSRDFSGIHRYTYADYNVRVAKLANALKRLGVRRGERVATFGWNSHRHLEAYFAVPCMGAVLHTLNIRLFEDQFTFIVNHAEDAVMLVDEDLLPAVEALADKFPTVRAFVVMSDKKIVPPTKLSPVYSYEALLDAETGECDWPSLRDENTMAALCYTTATTGNPKGVPYSHRGIYLHALAICSADVLGIREADAVMPVVPMFHVNAWGIPFAAAWMGSKQVFPGARPDAKALLSLIRDEKVTISAGVPTVWMGVLQLMEREKYDVSSLKAIICGGSAAPKALIEKVEKGFGVPFIHAYGMTETYPVVLVSRPKSYMKDLPEDELYACKGKQGTLVPGLEMRVVTEDGAEAPRDGKSMGELRLRGPWITEEYYREPERTRETIRDGWLCTGDVVTVDPEGYVQILDRTRDLIKSGGEWISSIDLENTIMSHPAVAEAAVIGVPSEKWTERPMACVVLKPDFAGKVEGKEILDFLATRVAKWWIPDEVVFVDAIPKTSVGKFAKRFLRDRFKEKLFA
ncbi:MAG: long-chain fatty acid--CoA ligase [Desulfobacteria bacterium]|nr:long-chain fatty acid--CoA ligase [Deltaproteobacteria bacterium]OYV99231.1 MAG: fatty-acid--CoA ligase [Deltaproteobacteria bacterium 37-65-8]HQT97597.1 long-chain fatty acid--CoA ligase [Thermodesulfobacteriota bacterium]